MTRNWRIARLVLAGTLAVLLAAGLYWLSRAPAPPRTDEPPAPATAPAGATLRIGLIPERDVFEQRRRYAALARYLSLRLGRPVELATLNTYEAVLADLAEKKVEAAFLGSLVAVLAMDRLGARPVVKPLWPGSVSTYRGVLVVQDASPIRELRDLAGRTLAMVRTTTAGNLFPSCLMARYGLADAPTPPKIVWMGTHDDVARAVARGEVDAGALKDLRLEAQLKAHPEWKLRRLLASKAVPSNALIVRADLAETLAPTLRELLLGMQDDPAGRKTLATLGAERFLPCSASEYKPVYDMVDCVGRRWPDVGVAGPPPKRPAGMPHSVSDRCYDVNYSSSSAR